MNDTFPQAGLCHAIELLRQPPADALPLPDHCPETGIGEEEALTLLAPHVITAAARLDSPTALAHMDPPTPWITWATALWNASLNQNMLHPETAPFAREAERRLIHWLSPFFGGMDNGHLCAGSSLANLTALWAARDSGGATTVVASADAHISIDKAAKILGMTYRKVPTDADGRLDADKLGDLSQACLVLTAGATATGEIDPLELAGQALWTHVDAAWAGPLRLSPAHASLLDGIEQADSIAVSAHKWLFQPKGAAFILFRRPQPPAISFGGSYLAAANIGIQGTRAAAAVPLLATLLAWGRSGVVAQIDRTLRTAQALAAAICRQDGLILRAPPKTGITLFRRQAGNTRAFYQALPVGMFSTCTVNGSFWIRSVAANPMANVEDIIAHLVAAGQQFATDAARL